MLITIVTVAASLFAAQMIEDVITARRCRAMRNKS